MNEYSLAKVQSSYYPFLIVLIDFNQTYTSTLGNPFVHQGSRQVHV